jgi:hypothetical protein
MLHVMKIRSFFIVKNNCKYKKDLGNAHPGQVSKSCITVDSAISTYTGELLALLPSGEYEV